MIRMRVNKKKCIASTDGIIVDLHRKGLDFPTIMTVRYEVDSISYEVKESVKLKSETIKLGFLPVGQKKTAVMPDATVGTTVIVMYNPSEPTESYVRDNVGKMNC